MKVSVIIPVYNAQEYLREAVDSVLKQTWKNIEILLINDGSYDGSGEICDIYAAEYPHVQVVHINNSGVGNARNEGLRIATGDYIVFVDADDYLPQKDSIQKLVTLLDTTKADIAVGNYCRLWDNQYLEATKHSAFSQMNRDSCSFRYCGFFSVGTLSYAWGKAYRHSFLKEHGIRFGSYEYAEDKAFNFLCYAERARYAFLNDVVYIYRKNNDSVSNRIQWNPAQCWLQIAGDLQHYLAEKNLREKYGDFVAYTICFAAFFDGKAKYVKSGRSCKAVKELLQTYAASPLAYHYFCDLSQGKHIQEVSNTGWKIALWGFSSLMRIKALGILSLGIKFLIDLRIDERLSDTGLKKK